MGGVGLSRSYSLPCPEGAAQGSSSMVFGLSMALRHNISPSLQYWLLQKAPAIIQQGMGAASQPQIWGRSRGGTEACRSG